jgi:hypothetical protein
VVQAGEPITEQQIDAFLEDYEMVGEAEDGRDACYTPTEGDKVLIKDAFLSLLADRASSGAAAPFAKDSWQHAVDNQLVGFGRTSQEFANPHEAIAWLALMHMELGHSNEGAAQAVRMLTREELNDVALSEQVGWGPGEYVEAVQRAFCRINAGKRIPADGEVR